jgi:dipeptidyl aminopeptidase/acylaminoacyl peptidase
MKGRGLLLSMGILCTLVVVACRNSGGSQQPQASVTSSGQTADVTLAYTRDDATRLFIRRHVLDSRAGEEQEVPLPDGCGQVAELALAPGAQKLAVACGSEPWPLYIVDLQRLHYLQVAGQRGGGPRWSPDGATLAYGVSTVVEERAPSAPTAIRLVSSDGTNDRELVPPHLWQGAGPWAPDGKSILVTTCVPIDQLRGYLLITERHWLEGERQPDIVSEGVRPLDWSLRAGAVLGSHDFCPEGSERPTPWAVEVPFGNSYAVAPPNMVPAGWLHSGQQAVLYWARSPETTEGEIWLADREGSWQLERVLSVPEGINDLELAPDRRSILYVDGSGGLYAWDVVQRGQPRRLGGGAPATLSAALDSTGD